MATTFEMGCKMIITLLCFTLLGVVEAIEINITDGWVADLGWEVKCTFRIPSPDRLQSVRLYKDNQQFLIFKPEVEGSKRSEFFNAPKNLMRVDCLETVEETNHGQCLLLVEPYQPPDADFTFSCEVSGKGVEFKRVVKEHVVRAKVAPSKARLAVSTQQEQLPSRAALNCSSAGLPAPALHWTVAHHPLTTKADFTGRVWNVTSKLWHVWSFLSLAPASDQPVEVTCTPVNIAGRGFTATYNITSGAFSIVAGGQVFVIALATLLLLR